MRTQEPVPRATGPLFFIQAPRIHLRTCNLVSHAHSDDLLKFKGSISFLLPVLAGRCLCSKHSASKSVDGASVRKNFSLPNGSTEGDIGGRSDLVSRRTLTLVENLGYHLK